MKVFAISKTASMGNPSWNQINLQIYFELNYSMMLLPISYHSGDRVTKWPNAGPLRKAKVTLCRRTIHLGWVSWEELVPQVVWCLLACPSLYSSFNNIRSLQSWCKGRMKCFRTVRVCMDVFYEFKFCEIDISRSQNNAV